MTLTLTDFGHGGQCQPKQAIGVGHTIEMLLRHSRVPMVQQPDTFEERSTARASGLTDFQTPGCHREIPIEKLKIRFCPTWESNIRLHA